ncbi:MAG TPA: sigma-70 family RNA polymerase sigma factor [Anaerolineales bacterium]|nr:sigma-70 family RNA polymerase sigma factor [Anaerolineales bacterium]
MDESRSRESVYYPMKLRKSSHISNIPSTETASTSFESLFYEYWSSIYRLLLRLVIDPAEAEDLALETFFRLYQRHPEPDKEFNTPGWLHRVASNLALHSIRSFQRREHYELTAGKGALEQEPENRPSEIFAEKEDQRFARLALSQMNTRQAELLIMRYSGMSYQEIAQQLSLSTTSIGPLLLRAERDFEKRYRALLEEKP